MGYGARIRSSSPNFAECRTESQADGAPETGLALGPEGRARVPRAVVTTATADYAAVSRTRTSRIRHAPSRILPIPVRTPLRHIPNHVIQPPMHSLPSASQDESDPDSSHSTTQSQPLSLLRAFRQTSRFRRALIARANRIESLWKASARNGSTPSVMS